MITLVIIFLLVLAMYAYLEASVDDFYISRGIGINHGRALAKRLITSGFIVAIAMAIDAIVQGWWHGLLLIPMGWAWWTMLFRLFLNLMRGKDWRYVAPWSNRYDRVLYAVACLTWWTDGQLRSHEILLRGYERSTIADPSDIHRAGSIAYAFEGAILAGSLITYFTTA